VDGGLDEGPGWDLGREGLPQPDLEGDAQVHAGVDGVERALGLGHHLSLAPGEPQARANMGAKSASARTWTKSGTETSAVASSVPSTGWG
jgi:hypothetical protein